MGTILLLWIIIYGGKVLPVFAGFFSLVGLYEFYRAMKQKSNPISYIGYVFTVIYTFFVFGNQAVHMLFFSCLLLGLLLHLVFAHKEYTIVDVCVTFMGFFYVTFLLFHILAVRNYMYGSLFVWLIFISAWGSDTGAYFSGMLFGKRKLCPELSPKKTVEGAIGGIIGAGLLACLYAAVMTQIQMVPITNFVFISTCIGALGGAISQLGDLTASSIKRFVNIKDYGNLFPGHGGVLDRFDSILFTAPFVYYIMTWLIS